jgi:hypothetical protein
MSDTSQLQTAAADLLPDRSCQGCTLCCKLLEVAPLEKPRAVWCTHCDQKRGCGIYNDRPQACRTFYCGYRRLPQIDERWNPAKAKLLVNYEAGAHRVAVHVDPARPAAWRAEPYYSTLKQWARRAAAEGGSVVVWVGPNVTLVLPHMDKELGAVRDDQYIVPVERHTSQGKVVDFEVVDASDPRAKA